MGRGEGTVTVETVDPTEHIIQHEGNRFHVLKRETPSMVDLECKVEGIFNDTMLEAAHASVKDLEREAYRPWVTRCKDQDITIVALKKDDNIDAVVIDQYLEFGHVRIAEMINECREVLELG